ncbi:MAG TPA: DUF2147 domain-containing protein [Pseudolabrys sp.]|jgi:uncharacterized protein (DUF2147 family)|nr:DUF2147 domain-containing protein [Pseudolabrys sp.]
MRIRSILNTWPLAAAFMFCLAGLVFAQPASISPPDPTGEWLVAKRIARIKIVDCSGRLWGVVSWEAQPGTDTKNPDPNLRSRPTLGMPILLGMTPSHANQWEGQIYNSEDGNTYSASITLSDPNTLRVQGCVLGFLCGGENWTRVEAQDTFGSAPPQIPAPKSSGRKATAKSPANKPPANAIELPDDVCSRVAGTTGLSHERRLK